MEQEECESGMLRLYYCGAYTDTALERVETILPNPEIIRVPGAPDRLEGLLYRERRLLPVFRPVEGMTERSPHSPACVVLIRGEDKKLYGMAADEVAGGGSFDSIYRGRV